MSIRPSDKQKCPLDIQMSIRPLDEQECPVDIEMSINWSNGPMDECTLSDGKHSSLLSTWGYGQTEISSGHFKCPLDILQWYWTCDFCDP